ncbi:MAG TPA: TlpA disulfide reductase family protein [Tenuifilaceae bacterium]|nr:TlpA disulfide reductase family protein [Tenuifilaceae bacterium]HOZ14691.1 TlpA disulfide reductase family protein [Tenuifilaceae bacterium]HPI43920.1 TlpA disulfide reductase family protein [Tenuifilaceae bacterium]HPN22704.1 TlpA disulfide reductase family protein [Tenuifilaceae bacterium]
MGRFTSFIGVIIAFMVLSTSCSNKDGVTVKVNVVSNERSMLYFSRVDFKKTTILDSVKISAGENTKKFKVKQGAEPAFYTVGVRNDGAITLLAEQGEIIDVKFKSNAMLDYTVTGSAGSSKVQTLAVAFAKSKIKVDELSSKYVKSESETEKAQLEAEFQQALNAQKEFSLKFIKENPMSKASVMAIYQKYNDNLFVFNSSEDLLTLKTVASAWRALYPESEYTKGMVDEINRIEKAVRNTQLQQLISQSEISIPELDIPNKNGVKVKLSSLKGKVVLLDFWLTGNTNSLLDNRELLDIYKQYKGKGFEIYQVALDANRDEWISAVESANLPWISVCEGDANGSQAAMLYNVQQIPANFLIGKNQDIIGKNLYGNNLKKALAEALK